ncbi:MAG: DUF3617 domain-containing protein, partial [Caulobacteraceae bacterium]
LLRSLLWRMEASMKLNSWAAMTAIALIGTGAAAHAAAAQLNLPRSRAGYWQVTIAGNDGVAHIHRTCARAETPNLNGEFARFCHVTFKRGLTGDIVGDGACAGPHGISGSWHAVARGDFVSHYSMDSVSTMKFPGRPPITLRAHTEAHWVGPCPPGVAAVGGD